MLLKKNKAVLAVIMAGAMTAQMVAATGVSASAKVGNDSTALDTRDTTIDNKYGDTTYADRFMSLYDDVVTRGVANGYMSSENTVSGGLGIPYHAAEEVICEAPDYGHETTSEAMSYLVWVAAMHDNIVANADADGMQHEGNYSSESTDYTKAWTTLEVMVPSYQPSFMNVAKNGGLKATYSDEYQEVEKYPADMNGSVTGENPIGASFATAYSSDTGLYLLHWLADVDNWYGFGTKETNAVAEGTSSFTFINTFQRGEQESCWETVPFSCVETKKYGNSRGIKGIFSTEASIADQYAYTNAPDAEDRAIQAVYAANKWGVGDSTVTANAAKMGDECRNDMYDKYYKEIGCQNKYGNKASTSQSSVGKHYLMAWYTSWGGATDGSWAWQIGASHMHEFYQNPLAAYALLYDSELNSGMKSSGATEDYEISLVRQIEFYEWLQSSDGMFAGGCTNSYNGRYETYPSGISTFYDMAYVEHPVYADPGSNHWIGNQVWATQRLAELYYYLCTGDEDFQLTDGTSAKEAIGNMLEKWVAWFNDNTIIGTTNSTKSITYDYDGTETTNSKLPDIDSGITDDGVSFAIPASLVWEGQPDTWNGSATSNSGLSCTIVGYGSGDIGCVSSLANTLIYYAKAEGVDSSAATDSSVYRSDTASEAEQGLYIAKELLDRAWAQGRDEIGVSIPDTNGSLVRFWETEVWIPTSYGTGTMPNGDTLANGQCTFESIRSNYEDIATYQELEAYYKENGNTDGFELNYHRFWHEGDMLMALGTMAMLYTDLTPDTDIEVEETTAEETTTEETTDEDTTDEATTATNATSDTSETDTSNLKVTLWGDANNDGQVSIGDVVTMNKYLVGSVDLEPQGEVNANCYADGDLDATDATTILGLNVQKYTQADMPLTE